jgi:heme A synthase
VLRHCAAQRLLGTALLGLTVYLAILGIRSGGLHDPAVVMGNLAGGFCLLGLLGWLVFSFGSRGHPPRRVALLATVAGLLLCAQILLGGLTSANFAATSCRTLPDCHGGWWPGPALAVAMDLTRTHEVTASGQAVGGEERIAIHRAHRLGAAAVLLAATLAAVVAFMANPLPDGRRAHRGARRSGLLAWRPSSPAADKPGRVPQLVRRLAPAGRAEAAALSTGTAPGRPVSVHS